MTSFLFSRLYLRFVTNVIYKRNGTCSCINTELTYNCLLKAFSCFYFNSIWRSMTSQATSSNIVWYFYVYVLCNCISVLLKGPDYTQFYWILAPSLTSAHPLRFYMNTYIYLHSVHLTAHSSVLEPSTSNWTHQEFTTILCYVSKLLPLRFSNGILS